MIWLAISRSLASRSVMAPTTVGDAVPVAIISTRRFNSSSIRSFSSQGFEPRVEGVVSSPKLLLQTTKHVVDELFPEHSFLKPGE